MRKLCVLLAIGALAIAACGGGGSKGSADGDTTTTKPGSTTSKGSGDGGGDSDGDGLAALLGKTAKATYKVSYTTGAEEDEDEGPFTLAQDPPRFSYVASNDATYVLADGSAVNCSGSGSDATCVALPGSGETYKAGLASAFGAAGAFLSSAAAGLSGLADVKTTEQQIAGRDASCATIDGSIFGSLGAQVIKGSYTVCVDKKTGVMLQLKSEDPSGSVNDLTATEFGEPTDADFTPPATPSTVPGQ